MPLNNIMKANAVNCIVFGVIFVSFSTNVAQFLSLEGPAPSVLLFILGVGLVVHGLHLWVVAQKSNPSKFWVFYFSAGDALWVLMTGFLLWAGVWITTPIGIQVTLLTSFIVGGFGVLQVVSWKPARNRKVR